VLSVTSVSAASVVCIDAPMLSEFLISDVPLLLQPQNIAKNNVARVRIGNFDRVLSNIFILAKLP
ncbi:MAG TPA: hypothetical protein VEY06_14085, partial [Flavisolibacter sp.]|nr:hypothetical protein [Flavisolibacter sp.]